MELMKLKDEWRFVITDGALSAMTCGTTLMLMSCVGSWAFPAPVYIYI